MSFRSKERTNMMPSFDIEDYEFTDFTSSSKSSSSVDVRSYQLPSMKKVIKREEQKMSSVITQERRHAEEKNFSISPIVLKHRGMKKMEIEEHQRMVEQEIQQRVESIRKEWETKGYEDGQRKGLEEVLKRNQQQTLEKIERLEEIISSVQATKEEIINIQRQQVIELIRSLTKWVILREIGRDEQYTGRLLEKLVLELGTKDNLIIKVNKERFQGMEEILQQIQAKIGELKNVRIEQDHDQERPGIVIESLNGIIDGSFNAQMENLDKLFVNVVESDQ